MLPPTSIPFDIIHNIITELKGEIETLKQCSLVARAFVVPSQRILFSVIELDWDYHYQGYHLGTCQRLLEIFTENPSLAHYVRHFGMNNFISRESENDAAAKTTDESEERALASVLNTLKCLESFSFTSWSEVEDEAKITYWEDISPVLRSTLLHVFRLPSLTSLEIDYTDWPVSYLASCSQLKKLSLWSLEHNPDIDQHESLKYTHKGYLESLELSDRSWEAVGALFKTSTPSLDFSRLRELIVHGGGVNKHDHIRVSRPGLITGKERLDIANEMIETAANSIESFMWNHTFRRNEYGTEFNAGPMNLKSMPNLRFLATFHAYDYSLEYGHIEWVINSLEAVPMDKLEEMSLGFYMSHYSVTPPVHLKDKPLKWASRLDRLLAGFHALQNLNIFVQRPQRYSSSPPASAVAYWTQQFPILVARGIVDIKLMPYSTLNEEILDICQDLSISKRRDGVLQSRY